MYAIVKSGGKQYRVERGQRLLVERLSAAEGQSVTLQPLLYRSEDAVFDEVGLQKVKVTAKVISHERGEKLRVFKFKPKRGYKRRTGHRQELTRIEVIDIGLGEAARAKAKPAAPAKATAKPAAAKAGSPKAASVKGAPAKAAPAKQAPAKRPPAKRAPAKRAPGKPTTDEKEAPDGA
jgi:large subunit ribosomal protein L21